MNQVTLRFYGPLKDFLPPARRQAPFAASFRGPRSVKDIIEGAGVPHPEIDLILRNGESVPLESLVHDGDRVAIFPRFHAVDISQVTRVRPAPEAIRFILDGHLGKLARRLRLLGLDSTCPSNADDEALARLAAEESRVLLTRDLALLKRRVVARGSFIRETDPRRQLVEVIERCGPLPLEPFSRCLRCNGKLHAAERAAVAAKLPLRVRERYDSFQECRGCGRVYWQGSHWKRLVETVEAAGRASQNIRAPLNAR